MDLSNQKSQENRTVRQRIKINIWISQSSLWVLWLLAFVAAWRKKREVVYQFQRSRKSYLNVKSIAWILQKRWQVFQVSYRETAFEWKWNTFTLNTNTHLLSKNEMLTITSKNVLHSFNSYFLYVHISPLHFHLINLCVWFSTTLLVKSVMDIVRLFYNKTFGLMLRR